MRLKENESDQLQVILQQIDPNKNWGIDPLTVGIADADQNILQRSRYMVLVLIIDLYKRYQFANNKHPAAHSSVG